MEAGQPYKKVIINLCFMYEHFKSSYNIYLESHQKESSGATFLDCGGLLEDKEEFKNNVLKPANLDRDLNFRKTAVKKFAAYTSSLSDFKFEKNKHIRNFSIQGLPMYWLTDISEKHPLHHILFNVFYVTELLPELIKKLKLQEVVFIIPSDRFFYSKALIEFFSSQYPDIKFESYSGKMYMPTSRQTISFIRQNFKEHRMFLNSFLKPGYLVKKRILCWEE
jgi:hypothetical protein